jgi:hypothetical protein
MPRGEVRVSSSALSLLEQLLGRHTCEFRDLILRQERAIVQHQSPSQTQTRKNAPKIANLNIQLDHLVTDFLPGRAFPIQRERRTLLRRVELSTDDEVGFAFGAFDFDFDMAVRSALFDKVLDFGGTAKGLSKETNEVKMKG